MTSIQDQHIQGTEAQPITSDMAEIEHSREIYNDQHHQVFCESGDLRGESGELLSIKPIPDGYQYLVMSGEHYITDIQFQNSPVENGVTGITPELLLTILIDHLTTVSDAQPCNHKDGAVHLLRQAQAVLKGSLPMMQDMIKVTMDCLSAEEKEQLKAMVTDACANHPSQASITPIDQPEGKQSNCGAMIAADQADLVYQASGLQIFAISGKLKVDDDAGNGGEDTYTVPEGHVYWAGSENQQVNSLIVFHQGAIGDCVNGLTTESLMHVLKHRTQILNNASPSKENELTIKGIDASLEALDIQAKRSNLKVPEPSQMH